MAGQTILMTGTSGHIGYRTLIEALAKGYNVLAAVRSNSSVEKIKNSPSTKPYLDRLTFAIVPDITVDGAYDNAVKGVDYIVHLASPLGKPSDDDETTIIQPAVRGTLSILKSALQASTVRKVVITSSVAAIAIQDPEQVFTSANVLPDPEGPYENTFVAYVASKVKAYNASRQFVTDHNPHFDVINVMPAFVIGKNELATSTEEIVQGSNRVIFTSLLGLPGFPEALSTTCHVDDVAFVHIASLDESVKGHRNFGVNYDGRNGKTNLMDAVDIVRRRFPKAVEDGLFPLNGHIGSIKRLFDASETEETFNFQFKDFESQVVDTVSWYVEIANKEKAVEV